MSLKPLLSVVAIIPLIAAAGAANAQRVCIEEAGGVCLKYREAPRPSLSPAEQRLSANERRAVQRGLKSLGHYRGGVDGQIGPGTRRAIAAWQQTNGYAATGRLTDAEIGALLAATAGAAPSPAPEAAETPSTESAPIGDWDAAREGMLAGARCEIRTREGYFVTATLRAGGQLNAVTTEGDYAGVWEVDGGEFCMRIIGRKECRSLSTTPKSASAFYREMEGACVKFTRP